MGLIHVFNELNHETTYTFNGKLGEHIKGVDWKSSVILRGGYRIESDYEVQQDDIIYVRKTPTAATTAAIIIGAVAFVAAGVTAGYSMYKNKKAQEALEDAEKASKAAAETTSKLPFIKGARNTAATGQTFPFILGETLFTPYRLCPPHYTISGTDGKTQYYNTVLECGYNNILIKKIKMGETVIKDFSETVPQNGQYQWDAGIYYDDNNLIEIRQTGDFTDDAFNKKIIMTELSEEIPHEHASSDAAENAEIETAWKQGVVQELASHAKSVEVIILLDGLRKWGDDAWESASFTLQPQWTNINNPAETDWHDFTRGFNQNGTYSNVFTYNSKKQMRFCAVQDFTAAQAFGKSIKIRVRRTTPKAESNAKDSVYLLAVQTTCYDAKKSTAQNLITAKVLEDNERDKCCRIGIRVCANANTDGNLDAISVIEAAAARTWNGSSWSDTKSPTRNLAAWVLEVMTSDHHRPSKFADDELDMGTFGAWYEYCETQGFNCDGAITKNAKKKTLIETLCKNGNAALVYNPMTGKIEAAVDNGRDYSIALLNSDTIQSISTTKEFKRRATGKKVTYINRAADYDTDSVTFMRDGGDYDPQTDTLTTTALEYITGYEHAYKYAWRQMAEEVAQPKIATVKVGREAAYYPLYSRVELQHKSLKIGIASGVIKAVVWQSGLLKQIKLDGFVTFPAGTACGVIINCISDSGRGLLALKVSGSGKTDTLTVDTVVRTSADLIPSAGDVFSFGNLNNDGEFTTVTSTMKITNAEESDNGYTLTLVDYNPAVYEYGTLPVYKSNLTSVPNGTSKTVESQREYITEGEAQANASGAAQAAVDTVIQGTRFSSVYKLRPVDMTLEEIVAKMDADARNASASIGISESEILLKVEDLDEQQRALIALTKDQILAQTEDMQRELTGLIGIQAGAVTALVAGGGATGTMNLSINLPVLIDTATRAKLVSASSESKVTAVYARVENTDYYGIKGNAGDSAVKALWDDAVNAGLLASQIDLSATQINVAAEHVVITDGTNKGQTIIEGNKIRTALIEAEELLAQSITMKSGGSLQSSDYSQGISGWKIDANGDVNFNNGNFANIKASGFFSSNNTPFQPMAMLNLGYNNNAIQLTNSKNISSVTRVEKGVYTLYFSKSVKLKTHSYSGNKYIDVFALGNAADTFDNGFRNPLLMNPNWLRQYVDGRLTVDTAGYATVRYVVLYFIDNNSDALIDPRSAQCFIFGTETD